MTFDSVKSVHFWITLIFNLVFFYFFIIALFYNFLILRLLNVNLNFCN